MSFHPKIDIQGEIANKKIETHLYIFVNYQQDDWPDKLPIAEFAANNNNSASKRLSLFFFSKKFNPRISFNVVDISDIKTQKYINKKKAINISKTMQTI